MCPIKLLAKHPGQYNINIIFKPFSSYADSRGVDQISLILEGSEVLAGSSQRNPVAKEITTTIQRGVEQIMDLQHSLCCPCYQLHC